MAPARWITAVTALGLAAAALAGCGDDDGTETGATDGPAEEVGPDLLPPGTELADGLVVPEGAHLAGAVFRRPGFRFAATPAPPVDQVPETITPPEFDVEPAPSGEAPSAPPAASTPQTTTPPLVPDPDQEEWTALLAIDGNPFTVWDDLAAQVRELGPALAGSAGACLWQVVAPPDDPNPPGPYPVVDGEPAEPIDHLRCEAGASDGTLHVALAVRYGGEHPGTVEVSVAPHDGPPSAYAEAAEWAAVERAMEDGVVTPEESEAIQGPMTGATEVGPEAVDPVSHDMLPDPAPSTEPSPGDRFGGEGNCLASGYDRMVLPEGASLVATVGGPDGTSVLAVDDVDAAIEALLATAGEGDDADSFEPEEVQDLPLADGGTVRGVGFSVSGGGGACALLGSPDGRHLLVTMQSD